MKQLLKHKGSSAFLAAFVVVLLSGVAVAQVGTYSGPAEDVGAVPQAFCGDEVCDHEPDPTTTTTHAPSDEVPLDEAEYSGGVEHGDESPDEEITLKRPHLRVLSPESGVEVDDRVIVVVGLTDPDAVVTSGDREADVDAEGNFEMEFELHEGKNVIELRAEGPDGAVRERHLQVFLVLAAEEPTEEPKEEPTEEPKEEPKEEPEEEPKEEPKEEPSYELSAHQKWEAVDGDPLYNVYWGSTKPGAGVWIVSDHGERHLEADGEGHWETKYFVEGHFESGQVIHVVVETLDLRKEFAFKVFVGPEEEGHEFTAHQKYGSCGEEIPYDVFYGTGTPGETIRILSDYGSLETTVKEDGTWRGKVFFPEAPYNEPFGVIVKSAGGGVADFSFVRTGDAH